MQFVTTYCTLKGEWCGRLLHTQAGGLEARFFSLERGRNESIQTSLKASLGFILWPPLSDSRRMRTSTITRRWTDGQNPQELAMGFDQEAAAVLVARLCNWKMETEEDFDATRWLDRTLIRLCSRFGEYRKVGFNSAMKRINLRILRPRAGARVQLRRWRLLPLMLGSRKNCWLFLFQAPLTPSPPLCPACALAPRRTTRAASP